MITGHLVLEDIVMDFEIESQETCRLTIEDTFSKQKREIVCNSEQLGAIVGTSVCGTNESVMEVALPIAESAFPADWPRELRPMP